jgi:hypothetical protein
MSNKRPLSPESNNNNLNNNNNIRSLKRLKLHSIIQELRNEEANLAILKKLHSCQQLATRTNNLTTTTTTTTNGFHPTATRVLTNKPTTSLPTSATPLSRSSLPPSLPPAIRKPSNPINLPLPTKVPAPLPTKPSSSSSINYSLEDRRTQAKKALRNQLERDLLNIPSPKPLLQDILFISNPSSLEFQPYIGLEDVVQCLYELQTDRQRLPQRFTDRAHIDEPYICEHCGTDFTIRWWKHLNNHQQINILCDRCKKQVTRRTLKSEHSSLLKNVFVSAMEQEKEIEKTFQTLIKQQQKNASRPSSSSSSTATKSITNNRPIPPAPIPAQIQSMTSIPPYNHHQKPKTKTPLPQAHNFATKLSQQPIPSTNSARKSNVIVQSQINSTNNIRSLQHNKIPMPAHQQQQQQYRSTSALPQQTKNNQMIKMPKAPVRQQPVVSSRPIYPPTNGIIPSSTIHSSSANIRPTATKRRTIPTVNMK